MRAPDLKEKLEESEKLIQEISQTWEEKLRKTEMVHKVREIRSLVLFVKKIKFYSKL